LNIKKKVKNIIRIKGLFGSTDEEGRGGERFLRRGGELKHN
jgi:hypothetical protein